MLDQCSPFRHSRIFTPLLLSFAANGEGQDNSNLLAGVCQDEKSGKELHSFASAIPGDSVGNISAKVAGLSFWRPWTGDTRDRPFMPDGTLLVFRVVEAPPFYNGGFSLTRKWLSAQGCPQTAVTISTEGKCQIPVDAYAQWREKFPPPAQKHPSVSATFPRSSRQTSSPFPGS